MTDKWYLVSDGKTTILSDQHVEMDGCRTVEVSAPTDNQIEVLEADGMDVTVISQS